MLVAQTTLCALISQQRYKAASRVAQRYCLSSLIRNTFVQHARRLRTRLRFIGWTRNFGAKVSRSSDLFAHEWERDHLKLVAWRPERNQEQALREQMI